ncbi:MAG: hypothetical protein ACK45W_00290, partial [Pseudanabaena sp.]
MVYWLFHKNYRSISALLLSMIEGDIRLLNQERWLLQRRLATWVKPSIFTSFSSSMFAFLRLEGLHIVNPRNYQ